MVNLERQGSKACEGEQENGYEAPRLELQKSQSLPELERLVKVKSSVELEMERHTSLRKEERGPSLVSLRSLERGERSASVAGSTRSNSLRAPEKDREKGQQSSQLVLTILRLFLPPSGLSIDVWIDRSET